VSRVKWQAVDHESEEIELEQYTAKVVRSQAAKDGDSVLIQKLTDEIAVLKAELTEQRELVAQKDKELQEFHVNEYQLRRHISNLKATSVDIARNMTSMEVQLHDVDAAIAEETERLTLAYVPVIKELSDELNIVKEELNQERAKNMALNGLKASGRR